MASKQAQPAKVNILTAEGSNSILDQIIENTQVNFEQLDRIDKRLADYRKTEAKYGELIRAVTRAELIHALSEALAPFMPTFMKLKNSKLGFLTDENGRRENFTYPIDTVRNCIVDALLMGLHPIGNEMNIIGGNMYATKDGLWRLCNEIPGLTELQTFCDPPTYEDGARKVVVVVWAKYLLNGEEKKIKHTVPIRINRGMGDDAIIGKATRKILERVFKAETGKLIASSDLEDGVSAASAPRTAREMIGGGSPAEEDSPPNESEDEEELEEEEDDDTPKPPKASTEKKQPSPPAPDFASADQVKEINSTYAALGWSRDRFMLKFEKHFNFKFGAMNKSQADEVLAWLKGMQ